MHAVDPTAIEVAATGTADILPVILATYGAILFIVLLVQIILGIVARRVGRNRGFKGGFAWGFFFGVIGIAVVALRPREKHLLRKPQKKDYSHD